jgi:hypothetical protein
MNHQTTTRQPLTDQQLDDIEARAAAATRGPWRQDDFAEIKSPDGDTIADYWEPTHTSRNGEFITRAREDVPALLAEIRRLRAANAELAQAIRLTREYVGEDLLPAVEGWSWYDALRRHAPHELPADRDAEAATDA